MIQTKTPFFEVPMSFSSTECPSIIPDLVRTDDFGEKKITLEFLSIPKPVSAPTVTHTWPVAIADAVETTSNAITEAGSLAACIIRDGASVLAKATAPPSGYDWCSPFKKG
jgi:hypothetical protein